MHAFRATSNIFFQHASLHFLNRNLENAHVVTHACAFWETLVTYRYVVEDARMRIFELTNAGPKLTNAGPKQQV